MIEKHEMQKILAMLVEKTGAGALSWRETDDAEFAVSFPQSTLVLSKPRINSEAVFLTALNAAGDLVGRLRSEEDAATYETLLKLHKDATRQARHVDETLNDIMRGLAGESPKSP